MHIQVSDETSLMLFENKRTEYRGLTLSDFDIADWHKYADVLNVVKIRDDMIEDYVLFRGGLVIFLMEHVEAVYHRNGLRQFQARLEQEGFQSGKYDSDRKKGRRFSRGKSKGCKACGH